MLTSEHVHPVLSERPCVLCGERQAMRLGPRDRRVPALTTCSGCGHVWTEPVVSRTLREITAARADPSAAQLVQWGREAAQALHALRGATLPDQARLLVHADDRGVLAMVAAEHGFTVAGLGEPSQASYAQQRLGVTLSDPPDGETCDAAILRGVLQAEIDPVERLRQVAQRLAHGASLLVDVPVLHPPLAPARHELRFGLRHRFSPRALSHALALAGFEVLSITATDAGRSWRALARRQAPATSGDAAATPAAIDPLLAAPLQPLDVIEQLYRDNPARWLLSLRWAPTLLRLAAARLGATVLAAAGGGPRRLALRGARFG